MTPLGCLVLFAIIIAKDTCMAFKADWYSLRGISRPWPANDVQKTHRTRSHSDTKNVIGIPKVAYRIPGTNHIEWEDIHNRLFRERILFVSQPLTDDYANQLIAAILCLDSETNIKPITLYINSIGGNIQAGLSLYDTLRHVKSQIITINVGLCASTATLLLGAGTPGKRFGLRHSRVLLLQPSGTAEGTAEQIRIEAQHISNIKKNIIEIYSNITKQPIEKIAADIERDNFMSVQESKDYGLIDEIITNRGNDDVPIGK
ncbi:ATP-dependent Clp protease proteolytic subunit, putative [Theileria equi strain WA]|uniref:ATP-dependent Clp protease proteolytic subunit n=1 Tax=Theileria equi strain WA TaxID=1537102 RepID=L1LGE9_THEEQ|nr:ATP-dependent Clp protease proteolytic subunit, putative [Theileria equi strain WA]EKX74218.1 ATP-dependent Clp protease proteolytic subunit, putative [Theileria equi strain WA]|eukprot:XP_004833670.1 ATP-dependent Clp protease proteolytic subunit, putative [Theileria equi strain WA]